MVVLNVDEEKENTELVAICLSSISNNAVTAALTVTEERKSFIMCPFILIVIRKKKENYLLASLSMVHSIYSLPLAVKTG